MSLKALIAMLAKSSAEAVATLGQSGAEAKKLKKYLYVQTPVEKDLRALLTDDQSKRIVFLCGSSGDGKSELFKRIYNKFNEQFNFHLDATHSFHPEKNAIETLDDTFDDYKAGNKPLVVGINIGMMGNYSADGDTRHDDLKQAFTAFLNWNDRSHSEYKFVHFEDYPKFALKGKDVTAPFIDKLIERICSEKDTNPLFVEYKKNKNSKLARNFALLRIPEVQSRISALFFYVHLKFDQFLTARTVLDFIHQVLSGKGMLFDNVFCGQGSELMEAISRLDPCHARSKRLDLFQIKTSLGLYGDEFNEFQANVESETGLSNLTPRSWVRLFYMLQDVELGNNYHHRFRGDLKRDLFEDYKEIWQLHRDYDGSRDSKKQLRDFYNDVFMSAVTSFANRLAPDLKRDRFLLAKPSGYSLSARTKVQPSFDRIAGHLPPSPRRFHAFLEFGQEALEDVPVSVNFLELVRKINLGYRPNTHDKTAVVVLEELVEMIRRKVRPTEVLYVQEGDNEWSLIEDKREDEILVEKN